MEGLEYEPSPHEGMTTKEGGQRDEMAGVNALVATAAPTVS
jgi:hypothetical protein